MSKRRWRLYYRLDRLDKVAKRWTRSYKEHASEMDAIKSIVRRGVYRVVAVNARGDELLVRQYSQE
jgi:hypothetical protein